MLPKMPYRFKTAEKQISAFYGLNKTDSIKEGELSDSIGLSTSCFPYISQRKGRTNIEGYESPTDLFEWNGKLCVVDNGVLYYDGQKIDNVSSEKKQYAVVNTKLCIFPDKLCIDLVKGTHEYLDNKITVHNVTISGDSIRGSSDGFTAKASSSFYTVMGRNEYRSMYTYGSEATDIEALKACYNGGWNLTSVTETLKMLLSDVQVGDLFIPFNEGQDGVSIFRLPISEDLDGALPDKTRYCGYYGVVTKVFRDSVNRVFEYDIYSVDGAKLFSDCYTVGDKVDIKGTPYKIADSYGCEIASFDGDAMIFTGGSVTLSPEYYVKLSRDATESAVFRCGDTRKKITLNTVIPKDSVMYLRGDTMYWWDEENRTIKGEYAVATTTQSYSFSMTAYAIPAELTVERPIPDLDFICEHENRLWGVCNKDKTVYASEQGLPTRFLYNTLSSAGSYAVAVGSEGDFTAICSFGGVCCFKENKLHKILGSSPSSFYMSDYEISGVKSGSERSLCVINERLYYNGVYGVFAYSGGVPSVISHKLGNTEGGAVGGKDGFNYIISMDDGLFVYDTLRDLWIKEDNEGASAIALVGQTPYILSDCGIYSMGGDEVITWSATLPVSDRDMIYKGYAAIIIRVELEKGSHINVEISCDNGTWKKYASLRESRIVTIPLRIKRCDELLIRISGKGRAKIKALSRKLITGSEKI